MSARGYVWAGYKAGGNVHKELITQSTPTIEDTRKSRICACGRRRYCAAMNSIRVAASAIATLLILLAPVAKAGQIYKCTGGDGSVEFSNLACPPNTAASTFTVKPNFIELSDMRELNRPVMVSAGDANYAGAVGEVSRRDQVDQNALNSGVRGRPIAGAMRSGAVLTLAERIREAKDADAQRRTMRPRDWPDSKL